MRWMESKNPPEGWRDRGHLKPSTYQPIGLDGEQRPSQVLVGQRTPGKDVAKEFATRPQNEAQMKLKLLIWLGCKNKFKAMTIISKFRSAIIRQITEALSEGVMIETSETDEVLNGRAPISRSQDHKIHCRNREQNKWSG